jgi:hypothetical protein
MGRKAVEVAMNISLDQAIDIYASALCVWKKEQAQRDAHNVALSCRAIGDEEGYAAWSRVAEKAGTLLKKPEDAFKRKVSAPGRV